MCTVKKHQNVNNFLHIHFKNKTKSGVPFLPSYTFPASFNKICPRKWFRM
jgi:hypothetical protein